MKKNTHAGLLVLRLSIGLPMLIYGISKAVNGIPFIEQLLLEKGLPTFLGYGVYAGEIVAPILLVLGIRTRLAALVFAFNCLSAILLTQTHLLFTLNPYGGWALELLALYLFGALALFFTGAGKWSLSFKSKWD